MGDNFTLGEPEKKLDEDGNEIPPRVYTLIPEKEVLRADVLNVGVEEKPYEDKETGEKVKKVVFKFKITEEGEFQDRWVWGETSTNFIDHPGCRLRAWVGEIAALDVLPEGFTFNTDDLLDEECRVVIGVRSWEDKKTNETQYRNFVADVLRADDAFSSEPF